MSRPSATTRLRRSRSVMIPTSRFSAMTSRLEIRSSRMTWAAARIVVSGVTETGARRMRSPTVVFRTAVPRSAVCTDCSARRMVWLRECWKKTDHMGWVVDSSRNTSPGDGRGVLVAVKETDAPSDGSASSRSSGRCRAVDEAAVKSRTSTAPARELVAVRAGPRISCPACGSSVATSRSTCSGSASRNGTCATGTPAS